jgi:predicted NUDIX family NTP pyrophosphohydrolase
MGTLLAAGAGLSAGATRRGPGLFREDAGVTTTRRSAGVLVHRRAADGRVEVLLGHMGGPFWARKQERAWSVPKGEHPQEEDGWAAATREWGEETGLPLPGGEPVPLGTVRQSGGKEVTVWAVEGDVDADAAASNTFSLEWPRGSGRVQEFPELDRFAWVDVDAARELMVAGQVPFLDRLLAALR